MHIHELHLISYCLQVVMFYPKCYKFLWVINVQRMEKYLPTCEFALLYDYNVRIVQRDINYLVSF